ncbi:LysR family transcriptional regulator [Cupriavidus basilensis]|uniref:LysR family transcriptional regulator n=1 Tax=Cupriavidus basilensis TaxID=68895 RepID=A0ABT6ALR0_9BURK|nr:LysR family transcriptional regulator [Cupriavidus basilensis]MDF3833555.1 LysR family transcriptional regulator [Cupriavidus basilensis]
MSNSLKLRQLEYFIAVAEELSFRSAAKRLFITQPPLSRQIKLLEENLGVQLFVRGGQSTRLTEAGERFLEKARTLVHDSEQLAKQFAADSPEVRMELNLGITTVIDASLFSWIEDAFAAQFPSIRLHVKRQITARSVHDLSRGNLDVAVIGLPSRTEGLTVEHLLDEPMVACIPSDHSESTRRKLSLLDLEHDRLFWFDRKLNPAYHDHCERIFASKGFHPERMAEPDDYHVMLSLIAGGQGIALVPHSLQSMTRKGIVYKELLEGQQLRIRVGIAYRLAEDREAVTSLIGILKARPGV